MNTETVHKDSYTQYHEKITINGVINVSFGFFLILPWAGKEFKYDDYWKKFELYDELQGNCELMLHP